jgi:hypothetical protein
MSWTNSDLARPDSLYREHFQRAEERLQVNAKTTLGRHHPVPPVTRASDDSALTHAPGQPIARPTKGATPGAASGSSRPRVIGSTPVGRPTGQAFHEDGHTSLGSALPKPGSPGGERLRQLEALHARMRIPAPRDVKPASSAEVNLARQHVRDAGCERCESWLSGLASGAKGQGQIEKQARQQEARAQQRSTTPPRWPRGRS